MSNGDKDVETAGGSCVAGGNVKWSSHSGKPLSLS